MRSAILLLAMCAGCAGLRPVCSCSVTVPPAAITASQMREIAAMVDRDNERRAFEREVDLEQARMAAAAAAGKVGGQ